MSPKWTLAGMDNPNTKDKIIKITINISKF